MRPRSSASRLSTWLRILTGDALDPLRRNPKSPLEVLQVLHVGLPFCHAGSDDDLFKLVLSPTPVGASRPASTSPCKFHFAVLSERSKDQREGRCQPLPFTVR